MKILTDIHCHTNVSDHAHSSFSEMIQGAKDSGMELIAITNHAPALPDGAHEWHFGSLKRGTPSEINGVKILKGAEVNIIDYDGSVDLEEYQLKMLDIIIASIHSPCLKQSTVEAHTNAYLGAINNPNIDIIGHSGLQDYPYDIGTVLLAAKKLNKWIEINNQTFKSRQNSVENCRKIAKRCIELGVKMVVTSDAHFSGQVGIFNHAVSMLEEFNTPEDLIVNLNAEKLIEELSVRRMHLKETFKTRWTIV